MRDFGDRLITPAFVNAHSHLALGFLRGAAPPSVLRGNMVRQFYFEIEERLEPGDVEAFARMGAFESLLHGVGLVWDHYYHGVSVARALVTTGLAGVVAPDASGSRRSRGGALRRSDGGDGRHRYVRLLP